MEEILPFNPAAGSAPHTAAATRRMLDYIRQFATLSDAEARGIIDSLNIKILKKGAILLREGQIADLCFFVLKGCIREYCLVDGKEKTTHFYTEGEPVTPYEGTFKRQPSKCNLVCEEETILTVGSPETEKALFEKFPRFQAICQTATEEELGKSRRALINFITLSPEERYRHLLETRPDLIDRVPQYHLASYLGITPESLSRIRKRIMAK